MGLLEDLTGAGQRVEFCRIREIYSELTPEETTALDDAIHKVRMDERSSRSKVYSNQWLSDVLTANGYKVSRSTVARHISRGCSCEQSDQ